MSRVGPSVIASALLAALTLAAVACDGGKAKSEAQKDAEDHVRAVFAAFNEKDGETFIAGWTDAGFEKQFGGLKRHLAEVFPGFVSIHEFTIESFPATVVEGERATLDVLLNEGHVREYHRMSLVREDGAWKIDRDEELEPRIPKGVRAIDVSIKQVADQAFAYSFASDEIDADVAFKVSNADDQPHEFQVMRVFEEEAVEKLVGRIGPVDPGESGTMVLTDLDAGRYAVVCTLWDADGTLYASKGMRTELVVE